MDREVGVQLQFISALGIVLVGGASLLSLTKCRFDAVRRPSRPVVATGLAAVTGAALSRGAFLEVPTGAVEIAGLLVLFSAGLSICRSAARRLVILSVTFAFGAALIRAVGGGATAGLADVAAAILGAFSLLALSSKSLATQITAVAGGVAVGAVAALAALVSVGVGGDLRSAVVAQLTARVDFEATLLDRLPAQALVTARTAAASQAFAAQASQLAETPPGRDPSVRAALAQGTAAAPADGIMLLGTGGVEIADAGFVGPIGAELASTVAIFSAGLTRGRAGMELAGDRVVALGAVPVVAAGRAIGVVVAVDDLGRRVSERSGGGGVNLSVLPSNRSAAAPDPVTDLAQRAMRARSTMTSSGKSQTLLAARPLVDSEGVAIAALVARAPASSLAAAERSLLRWLLLLATAAALAVSGVCVGLAAGIGRRLASLTTAAQRLHRGDLTARTALRGDDEIGRLGEAFDEMAGSLEHTRDDLMDAVLRESAIRDRLELVVGGIHEAVIAVDQAGSITELNRSAETLLAVDSIAAIGKPLSSVMSTRPLQSLSAVLWTASSGAEPMLPTRTILDPQDIPVELSATPLGGARDPQGAVILLRDLRAELQAQRTKNEVIQRVSHELRTPLTPIKAWSVLLGRRALTADEAGDIGEALLTCSARLERSVDQLIFMATSQGGALDLDLEPISPKDIVVNATRAWQSSTPTRRPVTVRCRARLPMLSADRRWIDQALRELLDNAAKFSPDGTPIGVKASPGPAQGEVSLSITDHGEGLADDIGRLMAAFEQGDGSSTRAHEGLGLGLAIVDRVVRAHHGRLEATSHRTGVTVSLVIPAADADRQPAGSRR